MAPPQQQPCSRRSPRTSGAVDPAEPDEESAPFLAGQPTGGELESGARPPALSRLRLRSPIVPRHPAPAPRARGPYEDIETASSGPNQVLRLQSQLACRSVGWGRIAFMTCRGFLRGWTGSDAGTPESDEPAVHPGVDRLNHALGRNKRPGWVQCLSGSRRPFARRVGTATQRPSGCSVEAEVQGPDLEARCSAVTQCDCSSRDVVGTCTVIRPRRVRDAGVAKEAAASCANERLIRPVIPDPTLACPETTARVPRSWAPRNPEELGTKPRRECSGLCANALRV
jgi:hypothetical protein